MLEKNNNPDLRSALAQSLSTARTNIEGVKREFYEDHLDENDLIILEQADQKLGNAESVAHRTEKVIAVGGHFSCGKSSVINRFFEIDALPTSKYPDTGVSCWLRKGPEDRAVVVDHEGNELAVMAVNDPEISEWTSLTDNQGFRKKDMRNAAKVNITLNNTWLPEGVAIVDCPGINDSGDMEEDILKICSEADILIWVIPSLRPLSMTDVEFLERVIQEKSPQIHFVINAFLNEVTWEEFCETDLDSHAKIVEEKVVSSMRNQQEVMFIPISATVDSVDFTSNNNEPNSDYGLTKAIKHINIALQSVEGHRSFLVSDYIQAAQTVLDDHHAALLLKAKEQDAAFEELKNLYLDFIKQRADIFSTAYDKTLEFYLQKGNEILKSLSPSNIVRNSEYYESLISEIFENSYQYFTDFIAEQFEKSVSIDELPESAKKFYWESICYLIVKIGKRLEEITYDVHVPDYPVVDDNAGFFESIFDAEGVRQRQINTAVYKDYSGLFDSCKENINLAAEKFRISFNETNAEIDLNIEYAALFGKAWNADQLREYSVLTAEFSKLVEITSESAKASTH